MGSRGALARSSFFLDTHILLYWFNSTDRLSRRQQQVIRAASPEQPLWVSDISLWEIATLHELGRIDLRRSLQAWLEAAVAPPLVRRVGISPAIAATVAALRPTFHRDPADRVIVASTQIFDGTLLTQDRRIIEAALVPTMS